MNNNALKKYYTFYDFIIVILLLFLPFLSFYGTLYYRLTIDSVFLMFNIIIISIILLLGVYNYIPKKFIPLALMACSLSLLYITTLNSDFLWGSDLHGEYYFSRLVKGESFWNPETPNNYNSMLSIVMFAPIISIISGIPLIWIFKIIYPILYSVVPVVLFYIYKKQTSDKIAFLSSFFFISVFTFYTEMVGLARQQIGELFLVLIIFLMFDGVIGDQVFKKKILIYVFSISLAFSHYTISYIFLAFTIFVNIFIYFFKNFNLDFINKKFNDTYIKPSYVAIKDNFINMDYIIFLILFNVIWYFFVSESTTFLTVVNLGRNIINNISTDLFNADSVQGLNIIMSGGKSIYHTITKNMHLIMQLFIGISIIFTSIKKYDGKIAHEYYALSIASFVLDGASIMVPFLSSSINASRMYHISLILLSPFCVKGFIFLFENIFKNMSYKNIISLFTMFLCVFYVFNTGFFYTVANIDRSIADPLWAIYDGDSLNRLSLYNSYTPIEDIYSAKWVLNHRDPSVSIYSDYRSRNNPLNAYAMISRKETILILNDTENIEFDSFVYLRKLNLLDNIWDGPRTMVGNTTFFESKPLIDLLYIDNNIIYSNGGSVIVKTTDTILLSDEFT